MARPGLRLRRVRATAPAQARAVAPVAPGVLEPGAWPIRTPKLPAVSPTGLWPSALDGPVNRQVTEPIT
ncbi:hypothetical protein ACFQFC_32155 [Amorphoplanes digitatis]|uniref:Uncharacterized protein n=1 Tax=Actinoplanes digitatis TaxID=1868 RepID=A0A7W7MNA9_9ACTN|nr:hypothetical protein [Actinoplanes digitatis]MBB4760808.1 hypothetical protein [Actinoplanes digitatis]GID98369.1 hypothetical protein Adi01nite_77810 [Actinoplanes digitatis]